MTLLPSSAGNVDESWLVDSPTVVADELITFLQTPDGDGLTNRQKILILASRTPSPIRLRTVTSRHDQWGRGSQGVRGAD